MLGILDEQGNLIPPSEPFSIPKELDYSTFSVTALELLLSLSP